MTRAAPFEPRGVIPACLLPFHADFSIDERAYKAHLEDIASVDGVTAITTNGHAAEVHALTIDEQRRVLALTLETLGDRVPTVAGVSTNSSLEAGRMARSAQDQGAHCLLVFPPDMMVLGGQLRPEMITEHLRRITDASDLPIILFQFPTASNLTYPPDDIAGPAAPLSADPGHQGPGRRRQHARASHPRAPRDGQARERPHDP